MKVKNISISLILMFAFLTGSCSTATSYTIKCKFEGLPDGTKMVLVPTATHKDEIPVAEAIAKNGEFEFKGAVDGPRLFSISADQKYGNVKVMVENAAITITAKVSTENAGDRASYSYNDVVVRGSESHDLFLEKIAPTNDFGKMHAAYNEANKQVLEERRKAGAENNKAKLDSIRASDAWKKLESDEKHFFNTIATVSNDLIISNKDSWWGPFLLLNIKSYLAKDDKPIYEAFSEQAKDSYYGKLVKEELYPDGFLGKTFPVIALSSQSGTNTDIATLAKGKKYILVDFWASWCAPCRREIPNLKKLYAKYAEKGFEIVSISIDKKESDWKKALEDEKLTWPNFLDVNGASTICKVKLIPAMFLLDENGVVIDDNIRGEALAAKLEELFK